MVLCRDFGVVAHPPIERTFGAKVVKLQVGMLMVDEGVWHLFKFANSFIYGKLQDKESNRKYYFTDNGLLHLFLVDANTSLLENIVAITLRRKYGDGSYFWNSKNAEVDFVVPEEELAVQVSYSMADTDTFKRETDALIKLVSVQSISKMIVVTMEEESSVEKDGYHIELVPLWKWLLRF